MCQFDTTKITKTAGGKELLKEMDRLLTSHKSPPIMSFEPIKSCIKRRDDFKKILGLGAGNQGVEDFEEKDGEEKAEAGVELEEFVKFMDELSSNTGELSRTEFITAFRLLKREIAMCHDKIEGSRLTMQLFDILKKEFQEPERDKLVNTWISKITNATHHHVFEGRVSRLQLVREIKRLSERVPKFKLSSSNIIQLMRFIDVDGDDDLDRYEIEQAFNRASQRHYYEMLESHEQVLWLLEKHMKECRWSVPDLFRAIDADGSGALSLEEIAVKFAEWGFVDNSKLQQAKKEILAMYKARGKKRTAMLVDRKAKQTKDKLIRQSRSKANVRRNLNGEIEAPVVVKPAAMKPRPAKNVPVEASKDGSAPKVAIKFEDITDRMQIAMFCRHVDTPPIGNGDGTLSQMELQDAFRKMNQERAVALAQEAGMNAFGRLYDVIQSHYGELGQESVLRWFQEFDTSNAGRGDGRLSKNELRSAVRNLMELDRGFHMDEEELIKMLSFVDSSGDDDIGVDEIVRAEELLVAEENQPSAKELAIIRVFNKLKDFMHEKHWRVVDLFRHIDADDSSEISIKEFREALEKWNVLIDPMTTQELAATAGAEDPTTTPGTTGASNNWLDAEKPLAPLIVGDFLKIPQSFVDMVFTKPKLDGGVESVEKVTLTRLEEVVRYLRRLRDTEYARKSAEDLIKMLFEAVVKYRQACGFSADPSVAVDEWFQEIDVSQAGRGDGLITKVEFRDGIKKVELELERRRENGGRGIPDFYMSEKDLIDLIRYIDKDGNDDLDTKEIHAAFRRALQANDPTATAMKKCQDTLEKLEDTLSENGMMRIRDLFRDMCLSIEREEEKVRKQDPNAFPLNGVVKAVEVVPREFFERTLAEMGVIHVEGVSLRPRAKKTGPKLHKSVSSRLSDIRKEMAALPTTGLSEDIEESALERLEERFNQLWDKLERIEGQQGVESPVKRGGRPKLAAVDKATGRSTKSPSSTFRSSSAMESPITPGGPKSSDAELLQQLQTDLADRLKDIYKFS
jgi:Ca2+-binding EF-hand superfamily protein